MNKSAIAIQTGEQHVFAGLIQCAPLQSRCVSFPDRINVRLLHPEHAATACLNGLG